MNPVTEAHQEWLRQWNDAGFALAAHRREELMRLSDGEALAASEALLALAAIVRLSPRRLTSSGLVEQQTLFHRRPAP